MIEDGLILVEKIKSQIYTSLQFVFCFQNLDSAQIEHIWSEHKKEVTKVQSHQKIVASASRDLSIKIWNMAHKNSLSKSYALYVYLSNYECHCSYKLD